MKKILRVLTIFVVAFSWVLFSGCEKCKHCKLICKVDRSIIKEEGLFNLKSKFTFLL